MDAPPTARARGFTLIEIMVVVVIVGLLSTLVVTNVMRNYATAKENKARADLAAISGAARQFALERDRAPEVEDLLVGDQRGPFVEGDVAPEDPWGHPYWIVPLDGHLRFAIVSAGPDGIEDTDDDLWHPGRR